MRDEYDDEDEYSGDDDEPGLPWPAAGQPSHPGARRSQHNRRGVVLVVTALVAAAAGFVAVTAVRDVSAGPAARSRPPALARCSTW